MTLNPKTSRTSYVSSFLPGNRGAAFARAAAVADVEGDEDICPYAAFPCRIHACALVPSPVAGLCFEKRVGLSSGAVCGHGRGSSDRLCGLGAGTCAWLAVPR